MNKKKLIFSYMIPLKNIEWEEGEEGRIFLLKEKSKNKLMKKLFDLFGKRQYFRIHLDDTGTFVWNNINGKNSIKELGNLLKIRETGNAFPQAEMRVEKFILMLLKNKFIKITEK